MNDYVKVKFNIPQDEDKYPPVSVESVWAKAASAKNSFTLENTPFFIRNVTLGDTVAATHEGGIHWFDSIVEKSNNSLLRAVFFKPEQMPRVQGILVKLGCACEYLASHKLMAINVPYRTDLATIQAILESEAESGFLDYEEPILRQ